MAKPSKFLKPCEKCNDLFWAIPSKVKVGKDKYCSVECYRKTLIGKRLSPATEFKKGSTAGKKNVNWKGEKAGYDALHDWVRRWGGKPKICDSCGKKGKLHWANISGKYRRDLQDFRALCVSCHKKYDLLKKRNKVWKPELSNISLTAKIGKNNILHSHIWIGDLVNIGDNCKIQAFAFIPGGVTIEDDVFIGPGCVFTNDKHPPSSEWSDTLVKKGAAIGANATIISGITIGENAVVGAGSVITKDIPDGETWFGNPGRKYE